MKINESCIFKFLNINNNKKISKLLDKSGLEVNNIIRVNNIYKIISGKIIYILHLKNEEYLIKLDINKLNYITIKQNIKYNDFLKNSIVALIFFNKKKKITVYLYILLKY